jgi:hypothetical protein
MTAETPGTPATTWPTEITARRAAVALCRLNHGRPEGACGICWTTARTVLANVNDVVAGREAAAREEGRAEDRNEVYARIAAPMAESDAAIARLRAEVAAAQQLLNIALDGEEVSRGDLAYDVDTVVDQRDEARQEIVRLAQKRLELRAEVAAAEQRATDLVKGLRKAVKNPSTAWVDANIIRLLLRNAQVDGGAS